jgi:hypothetical protein
MQSGLARLDVNAGLCLVRRSLRVSGDFKLGGKHRLSVLVLRDPHCAFGFFRCRVPLAVRL